MITGDDCQVVTVMVEPGEKIETEPGSMMFQSPNIKTDVDCDPCNGCMRRCAGEPCAKVNLVNEDENSAYVGLTPNYPAKIVPIDLKQSGNFVAKSGAIMSRIGNVEVSGNMDCNPMTCCCTSLGFCRQGLSGDGTAFIAAGGTGKHSDPACSTATRQHSMQYASVVHMHMHTYSCTELGGA